MRAPDDDPDAETKRRSNTQQDQRKHVPLTCVTSDLALIVQNGDPHQITTLVKIN